MLKAATGWFLFRLFLLSGVAGAASACTNNPGSSGSRGGSAGQDCTSGACAGSTGAGSGGAGSGGTAAATPPPIGWSEEVALRMPRDLNPDPRILEIDLEARMADVEFGFPKPTTVFTYNGTVPGPLLRARRGDRLVVHFKNNLPQATTIHWHGVRVPAAMDGAPEAQSPVEPGATFEYAFELPDAGLFWYHPHHRATEQIAGGLYGAIVVDGDEPNEMIDFGPEAVLVLSDISVRPDGTLRPYNPSDILTMVFGRIGEVLLVNGRVNPTLLARSGQRQRWRIINAATTRYFRLGIAGHSLVRIGGDGGLREAPLIGADFMLAPSERADILITPEGSVSSLLSVERLPYDRGYLQDTEPAQPLFHVNIVAAAEPNTPPLPTVPENLRPIAPIDITGATPQTVVMVEGRDDASNFSFLINGEPFAGGHASAISAHVGETNLWSIDNQTGSDHPIHLHGFFFQIIDPATGLPAAPHEWKDTVNVPLHSKLQFAVRYDNRPGMWMYHCHILDHADLGLMGTLHLME